MSEGRKADLQEASQYRIVDGPSRLRDQITLLDTIILSCAALHLNEASRKFTRIQLGRCRDD